CSQLPFTVSRPFVLTASIAKTAQHSFEPKNRDAEAKWVIMMALRSGGAQPFTSAAGD
ncbi:unnamed protein product, partial [Ectocarpus sp. 8 AP-2014]